MFAACSEFGDQPSIFFYYHTKAFKEFVKINVRIIELEFQMFKTFFFIKKTQNIFSIVLSYIEETIEKNDATKDTIESGFLQKLLKINKDIAVIMSVDSLMSGIDTVSC